MTCTPPTQHPATLDEAAERAICWADHALSQQGRQMLDAVWWLSTHLAASDKVLHRALRGHREYRPAMVAQRRRARAIESALWALDRHLTGDARLARQSTLRLAEQLRREVVDYAESEQLLLHAVSRALGDTGSKALADDYARAVRHAPTRPHPVAHTSRLVQRSVRRLEAVIDHARDVVDSRHIPVQRRRAV